jgi:hypothetical protein
MAWLKGGLDRLRANESSEDTGTPALRALIGAAMRYVLHA